VAADTSMLGSIQAAFEDLLRTELGVRFADLRESDRDLRAFVTAYNQQMDKRLTSLHGPDKLAELARRAIDLAVERDVAAGRLRLYVIGMPTAMDAVYQQLLKEQLDIDLVLLGCVPPQRFDVEAYNARMRAAIERRFGARALERVRREADKRMPHGGP